MNALEVIRQWPKQINKQSITFQDIHVTEVLY